MFEEYLEEKTKKYLKIGASLGIFLILILFLVKTFVLKPKKPQIVIPPPPEEIEVKWPEQEVVELKKNVFLKLIKIEDYVLEDIEPEEGFKFLSLEVELENQSLEKIGFIPFDEWRIVDENKNFYYPLYPRVSSDPSSELRPNLRKPVLFGGPVVFGKELKPGSIEKGYISFQIPEEILIKEIIFRAFNKKIIFKID